MPDIDKKKEFNDTLAELVDFANVSGNRLTREQIRLYFKDIIEDEEKYEFIYSYLAGLKIDIDGEIRGDVKGEDTEPKNDTESYGKQETEEAKSFYNMYMNELESLSVEKNNREEMLEGHLKGDSGCTKALAESYLTDIIRISGEYLNSPLGKSDLVAEGNLALYEAVIEYSESSNIQEFEKFIFDKVRKSIEKAVFTEIGSSRTSDHLVERINALNDASTEMARELGREATLKELSDRLALSEDEIKELMKISIDALTIDESAE